MRATLADRPEVQLVAALHRAAPGLSTAWWIVALLRAALPAAFAIGSGVLIGAVQDGDPLTGPLTAVGIVFVAIQVLPPIHRAVSHNLGSAGALWLNDELMQICLDPPGLGHLEDAELTSDLTMARDFDLGLTGPPLHYSMDFIATGLVEMVSGIAAALVLFGFAWWAPLVLIAGWGATHWMLRESGVWKDRNTPEVRSAQRHSDYAYRLAVDPPAAKEVRLFGLSDWVIDRFTGHRRRLHDLQYEATRLRERSVAACMVVVLVANVLVFWRVGLALRDGDATLGSGVTYLQSAFAASLIAFGGISWAVDGPSAAVAAVNRLRVAMPPAGSLRTGTADAAGLPRHSIRFRDVTFRYPTGREAVLNGFDVTIPAASSLAIVGQNGAGKTTLAKLLCHLYDPQSGAIEVDGRDLRELDVGAWRQQVTAVFQDFVRYERSLRDNVAPTGAPEEVIRAALADAGADALGIDLDTILATGYPGGVDLSGGQWQRIALARTLCAVRLGARVVLLDEPTAQLDVRGEAEIFERVLRATRECTTILVSHRFSTVRHADRICVVEHGRVVEHGSHDELIARDGRYRTMFELQASRFTEVDESGAEVIHETL